MQGVSLTYPMLILFIWGVSLTHPVLALILSAISLTHPTLVSFCPGKFLLHIPCWLHFYLGSFSYTPRAGFIFMRTVSYTSHADSFYAGSFSYTSRAGFSFYSCVSLTYPMLTLFFCGEFLFHVPCWLLFLIRGVSLTHPVLFSFLSAESLLNIPCCFIFIWGLSLTDRTMMSILSGEFLLHIQCWSHFYQLTFSYTSHAGFIFTGGVSLTHPALA